ncbi:molybdate ABC transporter substrate-binding protein [Nocardioides sp. CN2-186]|uniref:molybdate ABC transporter substrate-binding protein n=1 Tax=Nocardioides tweenelious TaxID=3156607 RepID=UPI0032B4926F
MKRWIASTAVVALVTLAAGCGSDDSSDGSGTTTLHVFAASSLTSTFETLAKQFEASHDGVDVQLNFGGSSDLVAQLQDGAPGDVFASADTANMDKATAADLVDGTPTPFATNTLEIAVPPGNPAGIKTLDDLTKSGLNLVICAPEVPCGAAAQQVADDAGLTFSPVSEEQSVADVLTKVSSGEADAGLVYVTDVQAAGDSVEGITFPESSSVVNTYPIAVMSGSDQGDLAQEFVDLVTGTDGQQVLADAGFGKP